LDSASGTKMVDDRGSQIAMSGGMVVKARGHQG
jgi:hypothetical protein